MTAEQMLEAVRQGAEKVERALGGQTERDLVRALVSELPACNCGAPATWRDIRGGHFCDVCWGPSPRAIMMRGLVELSYAPALRALCARMRLWGEPDAPVAASDGGME